jgi:hypothetical protein
LGQEAAFDSNAGGSYAKAKAFVKKEGTRRAKELLSGSTKAAKEFRSGLKNGATGYEAIRGHFNPKSKRKTQRLSPGSGTKHAKAISAAWEYGCQAAWEVSADGSMAQAKRAVLRDGTHRMKTLLKSSSAKGEAFRDGLRSCVEGYKAIEGHFNPRRRKNMSGAAAEREAIRYGVPSAVVKRIKRRKPDAWQDAPSTKSQMEKTASGLHWDVTSGHNTPWRYEIRKLDGGYVVGFKARRKGSKNRYVTSGATTATRPEYYGTQNAAFKAMVRHIMGGQHLQWKNPGRRR